MTVHCEASRPLLVFVLLVLVSLVYGPSADAGPKGKLAGFLVDYDDLKTRTAELLADIDEARKNKYSSDVMTIVRLRNELLQLRADIDQYETEMERQSIRNRAEREDLRLTTALLQACVALDGALKAESTYQSGAKLPFLLIVRSKYEALAQIAHEEFRAAKAELDAK